MMKVAKNIKVGIIIVIVLLTILSVLFVIPQTESGVDFPRQKNTSPDIDPYIRRMTENLERQKEIQFLKDYNNISPQYIEIDDEGYIIDKDGYMSREAVQGYMQKWADSFKPVRDTRMDSTVIKYKK